MIYCARCRQPLGELKDDVYTARHKQRRIVARQVLEIECEVCHHVTHPSHGGEHPPAA